MDNQHQKIKGYRDLTQAEIDLMNRIKEAGAALLALHAELAARITADFIAKDAAADDAVEVEGIPASEATVEYRRFLAAEPGRWAAIAKTDIQTGIMALVRAVAQPTAC